MAMTDGDICKAVVTIECPDVVIAQNVWYWQLDDPAADNPSNAQITSVIDTELTDMYEDIEDYITPDYNFDEVKIDRIEWNVDKWETVENMGVETLGVVGLAAQNAFPHGVAAVLTGNTSRPTTRARKFIPGFGEATGDDSTLQAAALTALSALVTEWLGGRPVIGTATLEPAVVGQGLVSAGLSYLITSAVVNAILGYQRRRKPGVGA